LGPRGDAGTTGVDPSTILTLPSTELILKHVGDTTATVRKVHANKFDIVRLIQETTSAVHIANLAVR
jgi:hypothetical protein